MYNEIPSLYIHCVLCDLIFIQYALKYLPCNDTSKGMIEPPTDRDTILSHGSPLTTIQWCNVTIANCPYYGVYATCMPPCICTSKKSTKYSMMGQLMIINVSIVIYVINKLTFIVYILWPLLAILTSMIVIMLKLDHRL